MRQYVSSVVTLDAALEIELADHRPGTVEFFEQIAKPERGTAASEIWLIGLSAYQTARDRAQAAQLEQVGDRVLVQIEAALSQHLDNQGIQLEEQMRRYFDPSDGRVVGRLRALLADGGELPKMLERHTGPEGEFAVRLRQTIRPLLETLDPDHGEGVVRTIVAQVEQALASSQNSLNMALDPLVEGSPAQRFVTALRQHLDTAGEIQQRELATLTGALDANDENSLLSRLLRETQDARAQLLTAVSSGKEGSLLASLEASIGRQLGEHQERAAALLERHHERQLRFEREVVAAVARIEQHSVRSRSGVQAGRCFEDQVYAYASELFAHGPYTVDFTGNSFSERRRKVGDVVIEFTEESVFAGNRVVIEAKREANQTVTKALAELNKARKNRDAGIGVFVLSKQVAPPGFPIFSRRGRDILAVWDPDDEATFSYLHAALLLALGLASREDQTSTSEESALLSAILEALESGLVNLREIQKKGTTVVNAGNAILTQARGAQRSVDIAVETTTRLLASLHQAQADLECDEVTVEASRFIGATSRAPN